MLNWLNERKKWEKKAHWQRDHGKGNIFLGPEKWYMILQ